MPRLGTGWIGRRHYGGVLKRPPPGSIPDAPGSYQFLDAEGRVLYVGKAKSLRHRLANYLQDPGRLPDRTAELVRSAASVEWVEVRNEVEALILEINLIHTHRPRFNIALKDDKSYPFVVVTLDHPWPRVAVTRGTRRKGARYFGPYVHVGAVRRVIDELVRSLPVRTCADTKFDRHEKMGRPCLLFHIARCSGPCVGAVDSQEYGALVDGVVTYLSGGGDKIVRRLEADMLRAAQAQDFERAARLRDRLDSARKVAEQQHIVTGRDEDFDAIGVAANDLEAAVHVFHVRHGRVVGTSGFFLDKVEPVAGADLIARVIEEVYDDPVNGVPAEVLVKELPEELPLLKEWLEGLRHKRVSIRVPRRGGKRALWETAEHNAAQALSRQHLRRATDHNSRARALRELQSALGLERAPLRIECYDMSHLQGSDYVGSMVVMEDGLLKKSDYRKFTVRGVAGNDDYAAMEEVLRRRLRSLIAERGLAAKGEAADGGKAAAAPPGAQEASPGRRQRFAYSPNLLLVDGGKGQLGVAVRVLDELGLSGEIAPAALAKRLEEVFVPARGEPIDIARPSEALYLLQSLRDEAHRFAIGFHRAKRSKSMVRSPLEGIPGLGPQRRKHLERELGGLRGVRSATLDELLGLSWLPDEVARRVYDQCARPLHNRPEAAQSGHDGRMREAP